MDHVCIFDEINAAGFRAIVHPKLKMISTLWVLEEYSKNDWYVKECWQQMPQTVSKKHHGSNFHYFSNDPAVKQSSYCNHRSWINIVQVQ